MTTDRTGSGRQIPLPFSRYDALDFDLYLTGDNREVQATLQQTATGDQTRPLYLWGEQGSGKSHLLQATCKAAAKAGRTVAYVPLKLFAKQPVTILDGLEAQQLVCVDDLDVVAGQRDWEEALFHLFNRLYDRGGITLFAARLSPRRLDMVLEDLRSRLSWGLVYPLRALGDEEKIMLLKQRAESRGFYLADEVLQFLMTRASRDLTSLLALLDRIDHASLAEQRRITVPFVKSLLAGNST